MERERLEQLGSEALPYAEIARLREERRKLERESPPVGVELHEWGQQKAQELEEEIRWVGREVVTGVKNKLVGGGIFNPDTLKKEVWKAFGDVIHVNLRPIIYQQYLDILQEAMEGAINDYQTENFENRFRMIDEKIAELERKLPKPFSPALINVDKRFPVERIAFLSSGHADRWLTEALKSKPIMFDPWEKYTEKLVQFYNEAYLPEMKKIWIEEEEAKRRAAETSVAEEPAPPPEPPPREDRSWIIRQMNEAMEERYGSKRR